MNYPFLFFFVQFHQHSITWYEQLCCSEPQLTAAVNIFCEAVLSTALTAHPHNNGWIDTQTGHLWVTPEQVVDNDHCMCRTMVSKQSSNFINCSSIKSEFSRTKDKDLYLKTNGKVEFASCSIIDAYLPYFAASKSAVNVAGLIMSVSNCLQTSA